MEWLWPELGVVGGPQAHATPYAFAQNQLTNFQILVDSGTVVIQSASRNTINTANYNGSGTSFADPVAVPAASDAAQATAGPGPFPGENNYGVGAGLAGGMVGTRADSVTSAGNPFVANGGTVTPAGGTGTASVNNVAEGHGSGASTRQLRCPEHSQRTVYHRRGRRRCDTQLRVQRYDKSDGQH